MSADRTEQQSFEARRQAEELSLKRTRPPTIVPGYELNRFLGAGAYGEVWVGRDRNTGRQVAVKFYTHRGGLDWSLLSREVEKLVFLSADRCVVQLLDVGWDADPPYYVMEYLDNGSLEELLDEHGSLPVDEAIEMFREVAVGLSHAHGKGVLHCDLKPANILLDQDHKPRLCDFGQSRLSHEQSPALGTLFYMAPEQADLKAVPDARWDVYALGALMYAMLVGSPPYRSDEVIEQVDSAHDLGDRLARYRRAIRSAPPPTAHRRLAGVDKPLADIIDRCLARNPDHRYPNVQVVLDALGQRERARARRPLVLLGLAGPALLLLIMVLFGWRGYNEAVAQSEEAVIRQALESNRFAANNAADRVAHRIDKYFLAVERVAADPVFYEEYARVLDHEELGPLSVKLADPNLPEEEQAALREKFINHPARQKLQSMIAGYITNPKKPHAASWFACSRVGTHLAAKFDSPADSPIAKNYSWRAYFHGGDRDKPRDWRPEPGHHIKDTHLSAVFRSTATGVWKVAISTPVWRDGKPGGEFLGIVAATVELGNFARFDATEHHFAVLADMRSGEHTGVILQHPLFDELLKEQEKVPPRFSDYRVDPEHLDASSGDRPQLYQDPLGQDETGRQYRRAWLAAVAPVRMEKFENGASGKAKLVDTGLIVIIQKDYQVAIEPVRLLGARLFREGLTALGVLVAVVGVLWLTVIRRLGVGGGRFGSGPRSASTRGSSQSGRSAGGSGAAAPATPMQSKTTIALPGQSRCDQPEDAPTEAKP